MAVKIIIRNKSFEMMSTLALIYSVEHWDEFAEEMRLDNGPEGKEGLEGMRDEVFHFAANMLHDNQDAIKILLVQWGDEKTVDFINKLIDHKHDKEKGNDKSV